MSDEREWPVPQRPMRLHEVLGAGMKLALRTAPRALTAALVVIAPLNVLFGSAFRSVLYEMSRLLEQNAGSTDLAPQMFGTIAGSFGLFSLVLLVLVVGSTLVQVVTTVDAWDHAVGVERLFGDFAKRVFSRPLAFALAQIVVLLVVVLAIGFLYVILTTMLYAAGGDGGAMLATFAIVAVTVYLALGTIFRLHEIVADDRGPWRSLLSSMSLARGNWFRIVGTLLPLLALFVVASETLAPSQGAIDTEDLGALGASYRAMADAYTPLRALALGIVSAVVQFLGINLLTALYVDLRARRGDFDFDDETVEA